MATESRKRILIVDDDVSAGRMLALLLGDDYDTMHAADGLEGLRLAEEMDPDLIITDVTMPNMDGYTMAKRLHASRKRKVPLIFVTARGDPRHLIQGIQSGARHYLIKPIDVADLEARIKRVFGDSTAPPPPRSSRGLPKSH
jgi:two-component system OmpR family response regulator